MKDYVLCPFLPYPTPSLHCFLVLFCFVFIIYLKDRDIERKRRKRIEILIFPSLCHSPSDLQWLGLVPAEAPMDHRHPSCGPSLADSPCTKTESWTASGTAHDCVQHL